jgi:diguanylate cyclase
VTRPGSSARAEVRGLRPRPFVESGLPQVGWAAVLIGGAGFLAGVVLRPDDQPNLFFDLWLYNLTYAGAAVLCWQTRADGRSRMGWRCTSAGLAITVLANVCYTLVLAPADDPPYPSVADAGYLAYYPLAYLTVVLLARSRVSRFHPSMWLDGLVAGLGAAAVVIVLALGPVLRTTGGPVAVVATNLAYPVADLVLLVLLVGVSAVLGVQMDRSLLWLGAGLVAFFAADVGFLILDSSGRYAEGGPLDLVWLAAVAAMAVGARRRTTSTAESALHPDPADLDRVSWRVLAVPGAFHVVSLALLVAGWRYQIPLAAGVCAAGCTLTASLRAALTFREIRDLAEARRQALTDELTGVANRRGFHRACDAALGAAGSSSGGGGGGGGRDAETALLLLDLDGFKDVNDSLGHHAGDQLLVQVTERLRPVVEPTGLLARLGGDEFAMLLPRSTAAAAVRVAEAAHRALSAPFTVDTVRLHVGGSIGVATAPDPAPTRSDLLRHADIAMYQAKSAGTGQVVTYTPGPHTATGERLRTIEELRVALSRGQLLVHLQPQIDLGTQEVVGAEALVRWQHPSRGLLLPAAFLGHADQAGLQRPLADAVVELSLAAAAHWWALGLRIPVSVNLSPANVTDLDLPAKIAAALRRHDLPPQALTVELTEGTLMSDPDRGRGVLARLRDSGVGVSIDDYGTGYSSLTYLRDLPADELKLDRSFTWDLDADPRATAITRHTTALAHALGLRLTAEGIESAAVADALRQLGCDVGQGFHFARPMPVAEFHVWVAARRPAAAQVPLSRS